MPQAVPYAILGDPQTLNLYAYVRNNPLSEADPDGHCEPFCGLIGKLAAWAGTGVATQGGKQFAKNVAVGVAKGVGSVAYNTLMNSNPATALVSQVAGQPKVLQPSNQTQAQVKTTTEVGIAVAGIAAGGLGAGAAGAATETTSVMHFTGDAGMEAISESGFLRAGSFVTTPGEIPPGASSSQVESLLEIAPGRGTNSITFDTPTSNLTTPTNGTTTSGGAAQYQLQNPTPIDPTKFKPTNP
jgi:hypothetical protein